MFYVLLTLHSKRFQSSYCAKVKTGAKTPLLSFLFFALVSTFLTNSRRNACYAGYVLLCFLTTLEGGKGTAFCMPKKSCVSSYFVQSSSPPTHKFSGL